MGLGHKRRMEALAAALVERDVESEISELGGGLEGDIVVVDSYRLRADERRRFRGRLLVAVDDLERDLDVDVLVDPSPGAVESVHRRARRALTGSRYALVDPRLAALEARPVGKDVKRILVAVGGTDPEGVGGRLAGGVARLLPEASVGLAIGPWSELEPPVGVEEIRTERGLDAHLAVSDLVVTAGGVTLLESLCLGRPTVVIVLHSNQRRAADGAAAEGAAVLADVDEAPAAAWELAAAPERRRSLSTAARSLVDGKGAARVADVLSAPI